MNKYDFTELVKNPAKLGDSDIEKLKALSAQYPYFSVAQNLLVKALFNTKHYEYDKYLKQAALQAGNRSVLYNLVHDLPLETESKELMEQQVENLQIQHPPQKVEKPVETPPVTIQDPIESEIEIPQMPVEATFESVKEITEEIVEAKAEAIAESVAVPTPPVPIESPKVLVPAKDPEKIYEDEKLVSATGKFVKFIPKVKPPDEVWEEDHSLIDEPADDVLGDFDISSLNSFVDPTPLRPMYVEEEEKKPETNPEPISATEEEKPEPAIEPVGENIPVIEAIENAIAKEETIEEKPEVLEESPKVEIESVEEIISSTQPADADFLNWIASKSAEETIENEAPTPAETVSEIIAEPIEVPIEEAKPEPVKTPVIEDSEFVFSFNEVLAEAAKARLNEEIQSHVSTSPETEIQEHLEEKKAVPANEPAAMNALASLQNHEVNFYLAPIYLQVSYNPSLFEESFNQVFAGTFKPVQEPVWTEPFVQLKKPEPIISEKEIRHEPKAEIKPIEESPKAERDEEPEVKPKIADLPTPRIPRDPATVESILEKFMRENPSIARPKSEFYSPVNMARQSAEESEEIVSETLAQIYTRQGLYKKAIGMYEKLGLHYPEKMPYFASLISQIKSAHNIE